MSVPALTGPLYLRNNRVLVVDDEPLNLQVFDYNFGRDFTLAFANNAEEALSILREERVAVIIADHRMPGMQGLDLLSWVAEHRPETVRLLLTAHTDIPLLLDAVNRGILFRYIPKPWDADSMRQDMMLAIQRHLLEDENLRLRGAAEGNPHSPAAVAGAVASTLETIVGQLSGGNAAPALREATALLEGAKRAAARAPDDALGHEPNEIALAAVAGVRTHIARIGVQLETELSPDLPRVAGPRNALIGALAALIQNAVEAMKDQSGRRVLGVRSTRSAKGGILFSVSDTGPGLAPAELVGVSRAWFSTRDQPGMGLAIARAEALARKGSLTAEKRPAGGTVLLLELPAWTPP